MKTNSNWVFKDIWMGLAFLIAGILIIVLNLILLNKGIPGPVSATGVMAGAGMVFLGMNAVVRSAVAWAS